MKAASRDELNKAFLQRSYGRVEAKRSSEGLVENKDELVVELQQSLLDDVPSQLLSRAKTAKSVPHYADAGA